MENEKTQLIYLDNSATTKPSDASLSKMREALSVSWGNPSSMHRAGSSARRLLDEARNTVGLSLGIRRPADGTVIFTSGGSEANSLAVFGSVYAKKHPEHAGSRGKIFVSSGEHSSIEAAAKRLEADGFEVLRIPTKRGRLDIDFLRKNADGSTVLMAVMLVNNETGALYDVKSAADVVRAAAPRAFVHCDAVQAYLKCSLAPKSLGVDSLSVSAHKVFAPKGVGALYVSAEVLRAKRLVPIISGGGQEGGLRSGTENIPGIAAFGAAVREGMSELDARAGAVRALRLRLEEQLAPLVRLNIPEKYIPNILNITLPDIKSETMLNYLSAKGICVSAGSACSSHSPGISRALTAFGLPAREADCSLRISISHMNTSDEIDMFTKALGEGIKRLARITG